MAETPQHPPGSFGCCNLLIPLAMIAGGIVGFRQGGWLGPGAGVLGGYVAIVVLVVGVGLVTRWWGRERRNRYPHGLVVALVRTNLGSPWSGTGATFRTPRGAGMSRALLIVESEI